MLGHDNIIFRPWVFIWIFALSLGGGWSQGTWTPVFNGVDATGLIVEPKDKGTLTVVNGELVAKGTCCGYFASEKSFSHYRMKVDFKHGSGNSGLVWHVGKWIPGCRLPSVIELNINDGGIKDIWWTDVGFKSYGGGNGFAEASPLVSKGGTFGCNDHSSFASSVAASNGTNAWNTFELFVNGDSMEAKLNDKVWMRISQLRSAKDIPLREGKFGFLFEGNTMTLKNWVMMDLAAGTGAFPAPPEKKRMDPRSPTLRINLKSCGLEIVRPDEWGKAYTLKGRRLFLKPPGNPGPAHRPDSF